MGILRIKVRPGSRKNRLLYIMEDGTVKIELTAPPVEGRANRELLRFLSDKIGVEKRRLRIVSGKTSRYKTVKIDGLDEKTIIERINK